MIVSKKKAALGHFVASVIVFISATYVLITLWYPHPHFFISGGMDGLKIAAGVDLVLGPLLTYILFTHKKTRVALTIDMSLIIVLQASALAWGLQTIYQQRPIAIVFHGDSFFSVPAISYEKIGVSEQGLQSFGSKNNPHLIYSKLPFNGFEAELMNRRIREEGVMPYMQLNLYYPLQPFFTEIVLNTGGGTEIDKILEGNPEIKKQVLRVLDEEGTEIEEYIFFPVFSETHTIFMMFNLDGNLISTLYSTKEK